jgi:3-methyladenine DNA glycosylase AlkD
MGSAQTRKTYARHGVGPDMYGVSYANLNQLRKRIKEDHNLAIGLWASGNHDARILATMIAAPKQLEPQTIESWIQDADNHILIDALVGLVFQSAHATDFMLTWLESEREMTARAGWHLLGRMASDNPTLPDSYFLPYLARIEQSIHSQPNRVREAMNNALIAIGGRNDNLAQIATDAAKRIGQVYVDHGKTNCKTPNAVDYIAKVRAHQTAKASKKAKAA